MLVPTVWTTESATREHIPSSPAFWIPSHSGHFRALGRAHSATQELSSVTCFMRGVSVCVCTCVCAWGVCACVCLCVCVCVCQFQALFFHLFLLVGG